MVSGDPFLSLDTRNVHDVQDAEAPASDGLSAWLPWFGGATLLVTAAVVAGVLLRWRRPAPAREVGALRELIASRDLPFSVCSDCRIIIELPSPISCPQCMGLDCCVWVDQESERAIAMAAVGGR